MGTNYPHTPPVPRQRRMAARAERRRVAASKGRLWKASRSPPGRAEAKGPGLPPVRSPPRRAPSSTRHALQCSPPRATQAGCVRRRARAAPRACGGRSGTSARAHALRLRGWDWASPSARAIGRRSVSRRRTSRGVDVPRATPSCPSTCWAGYGRSGAVGAQLACGVRHSRIDSAAADGVPSWRRLVTSSGPITECRTASQIECATTGTCWSTPAWMEHTRDCRSAAVGLCWSLRELVPWADARMPERDALALASIPLLSSAMRAGGAASLDPDTSSCCRVWRVCPARCRACGGGRGSQHLATF
jgi:hypothetical protein